MTFRPSRASLHRTWRISLRPIAIGAPALAVLLAGPPGLAASGAPSLTPPKALMAPAPGIAAAEALGEGAAVLGAGLTIVADGTAPWEDRPFEIPGMGTVPGSHGIADPGDDTGPADRVVRTGDAVFYLVSYSIREAPADDLVVEVILTGPAAWDAARVEALRVAGCPGGVDLVDDGHLLRCTVGRVEAPPAITAALDLTARVSDAALQGDTIEVLARVRATGVVPDRHRANCPYPRENGCDAVAPEVAASAAPAVELRKNLLGAVPTVVDDTPGRKLSWRLDVVAGADGDVRGSSDPVGGPWTLPDWWQATGRLGRDVELSVRLLGCTSLKDDTEWSCSQPGGDGQPLQVTIERLGAPLQPEGTGASSTQVVGSLQLDMWVPEAELVATEWDVTFRNCFATEPGLPDVAVWAPVDASGQPNLGGLPEPAVNNCSHVVLPVPRPSGEPRRPPRRSTPSTPATSPPPRATPTPEALVHKQYSPYTQGMGVTDGTEFAAEVVVKSTTSRDLANVIACDKWDNSTHVLRDGSTAGVRVWWQDEGGSPVPMDPDAVTVEYATGRWGQERQEGHSIGRGWYAQVTSSCADGAAIAPPGWVQASEVDFLNQGHRAVDANDLNMVRARLTDPLPPAIEVWIEVLFRAVRSRSGTWLMNYGAAAWGTGSRPWHTESCYGAHGAGSAKECPIPATGTRGVPGLLGDMLVYAGVPVWVTKANDPVVPRGSPVINAGQTTAFRLEASTVPRPDEPPPPEYPAGAYAGDVVVTDTLSTGLFYETGSATIASEDLNANGRLDPGEDTNGNGHIDIDVPFEPDVQAGPGRDETTLQWHLGDLPYETVAPSIRFEARVSRLVPGGTTLTNWAAAGASDDHPPDCWRMRRQREIDVAPWPYQGAVTDTLRCVWAQVLVANAAASQIEKVAPNPQIRSGEPIVYRLGLANLANRAVEWFDAVDVLPRPGEPRDPQTRIGGGIADVYVTGSLWPPVEVWVSASDSLDTAGGGLRDGLVDPVAAWGGAGAGLGGPDWPCQLHEVGTSSCREIASRAEVTALRFWGPDPDPRATGDQSASFLPVGGPAQYLELRLIAPESQPGDVAHSAWGGRFEGLPLPVFDAAVVRVLAPPTSTPLTTATPIVTHTPRPPTPTATSTATPTPSTSPTAASSPTPTRPPKYSLYLPTALRMPCTPRQVDVVLVIDLSTSMLHPAGDGGTKLEAVMRAARAFLSSFAPERSGGRVALAAFNVDAWVVRPLTADGNLVSRALDDLSGSIAEGTRLDLGLIAGATALEGIGPGRVPAMVFLTDGMPNWVPTPVGGGRQEDTVLKAAKSVRDRGITIHTVGYGRTDAPDPADRISPRLLREIAGSAAGYHQTDDASELAEVFRRIAAALGCAEEAQWP